MAAKLNVLFLPHPAGQSMFKPWGEDVIAAIGDRHNSAFLTTGSRLCRSSRTSMS
jgi:hypothetical protein